MVCMFWCERQAGREAAPCANGCQLKASKGGTFASQDHTSGMLRGSTLPASRKACTSFMAAWTCPGAPVMSSCLSTLAWLAAVRGASLGASCNLTFAPEICRSRGWAHTEVLQSSWFELPMLVYISIRQLSTAQIVIIHISDSKVQDPSKHISNITRPRVRC